MENNVKIVGSYMILKGEVMFSNLKTPRGFKDNEDKRSFDITLRIKEADATEVTSAFDHLSDKAWDNQTKDLKPHKKKELTKAAPKYKDIVDPEKDEPTGDIKITLTRPEKDGAPQITSKSGEVLDREYLPRGSEVYVSVLIREYNAVGKVGVSYTLDKIRVEHEAAGRGKRAGFDEVEEFFKAVNEDELVF